MTSWHLDIPKGGLTLDATTLQDPSPDPETPLYLRSVSLPEKASKKSFPEVLTLCKNSRTLTLHLDHFIQSTFFSNKTQGLVSRYSPIYKPLKPSRIRLGTLLVFLEEVRATLYLKEEERVLLDPKALTVAALEPLRKELEGMLVGKTIPAWACGCGKVHQDADVVQGVGVDLSEDRLKAIATLHWGTLILQSLFPVWGGHQKVDASHWVTDGWLIRKVNEAIQRTA